MSNLSWKTKLGLALLPWILMVLVNEGARFSTSADYQRFGVPLINHAEADTETCSWYCHDHTDYCKTHHVQYAAAYFHWIDPAYFGIISLLMSTGNYGLANLIFLVLLWPLFIYFMLLRVLNTRKRLKKLRRCE